SAGRVSGGEPETSGLPDVHPCRAGQHWVWDAVQFEILSPADEYDTGNNASCVLLVTAQDGRSILLPGDIERRVERRLLQQVASKLPASVILAPHHGSRTSSSVGFVSAVNADLVIFSSGYLNRFGFPKADVSRRYQAIGGALLNTADEGSIQVRIRDGRPLEVNRYRQHQHFGSVPSRIAAP
ncbi:hypothetical protein MNBD_GAMMA14-645, partial [hydrothermal vent metagenome]